MVKVNKMQQKVVLKSMSDLKKEVLELFSVVDGISLSRTEIRTTKDRQTLVQILESFGDCKWRPKGDTSILGGPEAASVMDPAVLKLTGAYAGKIKSLACRLAFLEKNYDWKPSYFSTKGYNELKKSRDPNFEPIAKVSKAIIGADNTLSLEDRLKLGEQPGRALKRFQKIHDDFVWSPQNMTRLALKFWPTVKTCFYVAQTRKDYEEAVLWFPVLANPDDRVEANRLRNQLLGVKDRDERVQYRKNQTNAIAEERKEVQLGKSSEGRLATDFEKTLQKLDQICEDEETSRTPDEKILDSSARVIGHCYNNGIGCPRYTGWSKVVVKSSHDQIPEGEPCLEFEEEKNTLFFHNPDPTLWKSPLPKKDSYAIHALVECPKTVQDLISALKDHVDLTQTHNKDPKVLLPICETQRPIDSTWKLVSQRLRAHDYKESCAKMRALHDCQTYMRKLEPEEKHLRYALVGHSPLVAEKFYVAQISVAFPDWKVRTSFFSENMSSRKITSSMDTHSEMSTDSSFSEMKTEDSETKPPTKQFVEAPEIDPKEQAMEMLRKHCPKQYAILQHIKIQNGIQKMIICDD